MGVEVVPLLAYLAVAFLCYVNIYVYYYAYLHHYNPFLVYCRELAPGTVSLTGDRAQGDDSKYDSHYTLDFLSVGANVLMQILGIWVVHVIL